MASNLFVVFYHASCKGRGLIPSYKSPPKVFKRNLMTYGKPKLVA